VTPPSSWSVSPAATLVEPTAQINNSELQIVICDLETRLNVERAKIGHGSVQVSESIACGLRATDRRTDGVVIVVPSA